MSICVIQFFSEGFLYTQKAWSAFNYTFSEGPWKTRKENIIDTNHAL